jgi:hypothetical protein
MARRTSFEQSKYVPVQGELLIREPFPRFCDLAGICGGRRSGGFSTSKEINTVLAQRAFLLENLQAPPRFGLGIEV